MDALMTMPNVPMHLAPDLALREWYMTLMRNKLEDEGAQILPDAPTLAPGVPAPVAASKSDTGAIKALIALNKQTWTMMPEQVARELKTSGPGATDLDNLARSTSLQRFWKSASPDAFVALRNTIMAYRTNALNQMDLRSTRNIITSLCKFIAPPKLAAGGTAVPSLSRYMAEQFVLMRQREAWELNAAFLNAVWFTPDALVFRTFENTVAAFSALAWELESSIDDHAAMFGTVAPLIPEDDKKVVTYYGITLGNWARVVQLATKPVTHGLRWLLGHIEQHAAAWQYSTELTQMSGRQLIGQDRNEKWASTLKSLLITDSSQHSILVRTRTVGNEGGFTSNPAALYQSSFEYEFLIRLFIINRETR